MIRGSLTGRRFGMLTVEGVESTAGWGEPRYWCRCDCGRRTLVFAGNLRSGNTGSCGAHRAHLALFEQTSGRLPTISRLRPRGL